MISLSLAPEHEIPDICDESEGLPQNQHRVVPEYSVGDDERRTEQAYDPKACRQERFFTPYGVEPLIDKPQGKHYLSRRAEEEQPDRYVFIAEECVGKRSEVRQDKCCRHNRRGYEDYFQENAETLPKPFPVQIPKIDIIGNELSEND